MPKYFRTPLACAAAVLAVLLTLAAPASASGPRSGAERAFLTDMIGHHTMAVEMARMASEKATHPELKTLADTIVRTQQAEIRRMSGWLRRWYGRRVTDEHAGMDHDDMQMLEEATGPAFEVRFLSMMSVHHTQAVERARAVRRARLHGKVRSLTSDIVRDQERQIVQMQDRLVAWYAN